MMMHPRNVFSVAMAIGLAVALAGSALAVPIVYESFDYPVGESIDGRTATGGTWTGDPVRDIMVAPGKEYYAEFDDQNLVTAGNYMEWNGNPQLAIDMSLWPETHKIDDGLGNPNSVQLGGPGAEIWMSYIRNASDIPPNATGGYWYEDIAIGSGVLLGRYYWNQTLSVAGWGGANLTTWPANQEAFVLVRHKTNLAGDQTTIDMWVNPPLDDEAALETTFPGTLRSTGVGGAHIFDALNFRDGGGDQYLFDVDEIRMGTSYADVTPSSANPVRIWEGGTDTWNVSNWNDGTTGGLAPLDGATYTIDHANADSVVTLDYDYTSGGSGTAGSLSIGENNASELIVSGTGALEVTRDVTVGASGTLQVAGTLDARGLSAASGSNLSVDGTVTLTKDASNQGGNVEIAASSTVSVGATGTIGANIINVGQTPTLTAGATLNATSELNLNASMDASGANLGLSTATVNVNTGTLTLDSALATDIINVAEGAGVSSSADVSAATSVSLKGGNVTLSGGAQLVVGTAPASGTAAWEVTTDGTLRVQNPTTVPSLVQLSGGAFSVKGNAGATVTWQEGFETDGEGTRYTSNTFNVFEEDTYRYWERRQDADELEAPPEGNWFWGGQMIRVEPTVGMGTLTIGNGTDGPIAVTPGQALILEFAAGALGNLENNDYVNVFALDADNPGADPIQLENFQGNVNQEMRSQMYDVAVEDRVFTEFAYDLPDGISNLQLYIESWNSYYNENLAIDNLRIGSYDAPAVSATSLLVTDASELIAQGAVEVAFQDVTIETGASLEITGSAPAASFDNMIFGVQGSAGSCGFAETDMLLNQADADAFSVNWDEGGDASSMFGGTYTLMEYTGTAMDFGPGAKTSNPAGNIGAAYISSMDYGEDVNQDGSLFAMKVTLFEQKVGDVDLDGDVEFSDLSNLLDNWGIGTTWGEGDTDFSGDVVFADLSNLLDNWGTPLELPAASTGIGVVPEPGTLMMLIAGMAGLLIYRKRR